MSIDELREEFDGERRLGGGGEGVANKGCLLTPTMSIFKNIKNHFLGVNPFTNPSSRDTAETRHNIM